MAVPTPRCHAHHIWHASCIDCAAQRKAERAATLARRERVRLEAGAL